MRRHVRHVWLDVGDFDVIVALVRTLRTRGNVGVAMRAGRSHHVGVAGGIGMQGTVRARMRLALVLAGCFLRGLLSARGQRAGIVRRFRRKDKFCFQFSDARRQRRDLPALFGDDRRLHEDQVVSLGVV